MLISRKFLTLALFLGLLFAGCDQFIDASGSSGPTDFAVTVKNVNKPHPVLKSGAVASPGKGNLGPDSPALFPGESVSFSFTAPPSTLPPLGGSGMHLNLATMFVQSNDLFYAFPPEGLDLYDGDGNAVTGDVTDQLVLYDAGTEEDTAPGTGPNQKPAQDPTATDVGPDENENVQPVGQAATNDFDYPDASDVIQVTLQHDGGVQFTVTVENVSESGTIDSDRAGGSVPLSPFAWAVYENATPFVPFKVGEPASKGIELIAEDGFPADMIGDINLPPEQGLADVLAQKTGLINPLSPPAFAVHESGFQVFEEGSEASNGIELIAEDGFPAGALGKKNLPPESGLVEALKGESAVSMVGARANPGGKVPALEPAPGGDGEAVTFTIHDATQSDRLFFATMFVQSNDFFYAFDENGLSLFNRDGTPISGDVTGRVMLYDAGTEVDEEPGVGPTQKPRQGPTAVDVGQDEGGVITTVVPEGPGGGDNDGFSYPPTKQFIKVTIRPK